jgi:hypothetical protein
MRKARIRVLTADGVSDVELDLRPGAESSHGREETDAGAASLDTLLALPGVRRVVTRLRAESKRKRGPSGL